MVWLLLLLTIVSHTAAAPHDVSKQSGGAIVPGDVVAARARKFVGGVNLMCSRGFPGPLLLRGGGEGKEGQTMSERKVSATANSKVSNLPSPLPPTLLLDAALPCFPLSRRDFLDFPTGKSQQESRTILSALVAPLSLTVMPQIRYDQRRKKERRRREKEKEMANRLMGEVPEIQSVGEVVPASNVPTGDEAAAIAKMRSEAKLQTPVLDSTKVYEKETRRDAAGGGAVDQLERRSEGLPVRASNMEDADTMEDQLRFEQRVLKEVQVFSDVPSSHAGREDASLYDSPPRKGVGTTQGSQYGATTPTLR